MIIIRRDNDTLFTVWYRKPTSTERFLNFSSHHPLPMRKAMVFNLVDKIMLLSHPSFHKKNFDFITSALIKNNYPLSFIKKHLKIRINKLHSRKESQSSKKPAILYIISLPYFQSLNNSIKSNLKKFNITLVNSIHHKFTDIVKLGKDKIDVLENRNCVYKIRCNDCVSSYVGQTGRSLKRRLYEHQNNVKNHDARSVLALHCDETGHSFDFDKPVVLDSEVSTFRREFLEMLHIHNTPHNINIKTDTQKLKYVYKRSLSFLKCPKPPPFVPYYLLLPNFNFIVSDIFEI